VTAGGKATYAAPAVQKTFEILELLERHPGGLLVSEMATLLGRSVGELFRIVVVVEQLAYLRKSRRTIATRSPTSCSTWPIARPRRATWSMSRAR